MSYENNDVLNILQIPQNAVFLTYFFSSTKSKCDKE